MTVKWNDWRTIAADEGYWKITVERGLLKAEFLAEYVLRLWFEEDLDVSIYDLDFYPLLFEDDPGVALLPLRQPERFQFVKGDYALIWPNPETGAYDEIAIDLAPECVHFFCRNYGTLVKAAPGMAVTAS